MKTPCEEQTVRHWDEGCTLNIHGKRSTSGMTWYFHGIACGWSKSRRINRLNREEQMTAGCVGMRWRGVRYRIVRCVLLMVPSTYLRHRWERNLCISSNEFCEIKTAFTRRYWQSLAKCLGLARFGSAVKLVHFRLDRLSPTGRDQRYRNDMGELWAYYSVQMWMPSSVLCCPR